jgi:DNA-binding transcriptional ArsR family regulator
VTGEADISRTAALIADPTRATILDALVDGRALPPSELAAAARVSRSTVSEHLSKMLDAGLLAVEHGGRNRYYRLAGPEVASALEALAVISPAREVRSLKDSTRAGALAEARTCYGHLAGRLGVSIADALASRGAIARDGERIEVIDRAAFAALGVDPRLRGKPCNDWSERRPHLAGPLGVALATRLFALGWIERLPQPRAVRLTAEGERELHAALRIGGEPGYATSATGRTGEAVPPRTFSGMHANANSRTPSAASSSRNSDSTM